MNISSISGSYELFPEVLLIIILRVNWKRIKYLEICVMIAGYNTLKIVSQAVWKELEVTAKSADSRNLKSVSS